jgi:hypothetical protein
MRNFLVLLMLVSFTANAQLEFVGTYNTLARLIYLSDDEPAIMLYNQNSGLIQLYNPDLTLISTFTIPVQYVGSAQYHLFHVSRTLFDCDPTNIEYLISYNSFNISEAYVKVFREDGSILFDLPEHIFVDQSLISTNPVFGPSVLNDGDGVLFVFQNSGSPIVGGPTSIYRSCGSIPQSCGSCPDDLEVGLHENPIQGHRVKLYPNPGNGQFAVEYELSSEYNSATLSMFDMKGREVLQKRVGPSMSYILVNTSNLKAGQYEVVLRTDDGSFISASYIELD